MLLLYTLLLYRLRRSASVGGLLDGLIPDLFLDVLEYLSVEY